MPSGVRQTSPFGRGGAMFGVVKAMLAKFGICVMASDLP
jgi:hypothetical protein